MGGKREARAGGGSREDTAYSIGPAEGQQDRRPARIGVQQEQEASKNRRTAETRSQKEQETSKSRRIEETRG